MEDQESNLELFKADQSDLTLLEEGDCFSLTVKEPITFDVQDRFKNDSGIVYSLLVSLSFEGRTLELESVGIYEEDLLKFLQQDALTIKMDSINNSISKLEQDKLVLSNLKKGG